MNTIIYLIQVSACTGIFYIFYHAVLSKLTFFTINRWYLLATLLISFIIPAITISEDTIPQEYRVSSVSFSTIAEIYVSDTSANTEAVTEPFKWILVLPVLYFSIAGIIGLYFLCTLFVLLRRIYNDQSAKTGNIKLLKTDKQYKNGSFFNCIFINDEKLSPAELEQIIAHELVHVEQKHSIDKIIARIAQVVLWFNPFVYAWSNAIDANHEYEVDHKVALNSDKEAYAQLILRLVASGDGPLYHHFSKFPLSKRITLLFTKPTKNMKKLFYIGILPLLIISCVFFTKCESDAPKTKADRKISTILAETGLGENPLVFIDGKEVKQAKLDEIGRKSIGQIKVIIHEGGVKNSARKDGVVDILTKDGKIDLINISTYDDKTPVDKKTSAIINGTEGLGKDPLVLIDNKEYKSEILYKISKKDIWGVGISLSAEAMKKYGDKARDGVVEINTKKGKISFMTETEKANVIKLQSVPEQQFYTRISLKKDDGSKYDRIIIKMHHRGSMSNDLPSGFKAAFLIEGKIYSEEELLRIDQAKIKFLDEGEYGTGGVDSYSIPGVDLSKYGIVFWFKNEPPYNESGKEIRRKMAQELSNLKAEFMRKSSKDSITKN